MDSGVWISRAYGDRTIRTKARAASEDRSLVPDVLSCPPRDVAQLRVVECWKASDRAWRRVLGSAGGAGACDKDLLIGGALLLVANGDAVFALDPAHGACVWSRVADRVTVFGLHDAGDGRRFVVHGELAVSCWTLDGERLWKEDGADIFTGELEVRDGIARVTDFEGRAYTFPLDRP